MEDELPAGLLGWTLLLFTCTLLLVTNTECVNMGCTRGCAQTAAEFLHQNLVLHEKASGAFIAVAGKGLDAGPVGWWYVGRLGGEFCTSSQACQQHQLELHPGVTTGRWKMSLISQDH